MSCPPIAGPLVKGPRVHRLGQIGFRNRVDFNGSSGRGENEDHWQQTNTAALVSMAEKPAATITESVCNVFRCVINPALFDTRLDFAVRDWARRSATVRRAMEASENQRLAALQQMFDRFGYPDLEAVARARILYYMQIGYDDAQLGEPMAVRNALMPAYLVGFTGQHPKPEEVTALRAYAVALESGELSVQPA